MLIVDFDKIKSLNISPAACVEWIKESFSIKKDSQLPPKCSIHPEGLDFYTSMPCLLPKEYNRFCLKSVHRISGATPALGSDILVYETSSGELLALMDCDWITAMRTGAVATLAAQTLRKSSGEVMLYIAASPKLTGSSVRTWPVSGLVAWSFRCTQEDSRIATRCSTRCSLTTRRT